MAILRFRVYFEEDDSVYRDVVVRHTQSFFDMHEIILKAYEFDNKHKATFYRSNDHWQRGRQITLEQYDEQFNVAPLMMKETIIGSEIKQPNQRFVYQYDFNKNWTFLIELINVSKEESSKITYPSVIRTEGIAPSQYGTKGLLGEKFADVEEKYDLNKNAEGFSEEGDESDGADMDLTEDEDGASEEEL